MLLTANDLSAFTLKAGEPFFLEVQQQDSTGAVIDLTGRAFVLSFYRDDRSTEASIDGEELVDPTGRFLRFARDGQFSESLFNKNVTVELAERYRNGRSVISSGRLNVLASAAGVASLDNGIITKFVTRITIKDNAVLGGPPGFTQQQLLYKPDALTPPVTLGIVKLSGTLTVGTASTGSIIGATTGSTVSESIVGLSIDSDDRTYAWDGSGGAGTFAGGLVETHPNATNSGRASPVTIMAARPTIANTNGDSTLLATQVDGAQDAIAPAVTLATDMGYL
ncbi:hypothetical protein GCM10022268_17430 [Sphingomonas cynarae]|uniref:Uncharacterized protein n=1 Tax=Sphingomonas cynarae TaxID=930197 RepID=A0ABP7DRS6_9SPHN